MTEATRIRTQTSGDRTTVRVLMFHEMESGQRKDGTGKPIPAWFIQEVAVTLNGRSVMNVQCGPSLSRNPFLQFTLRGAKAGDKLAVSWVDNRGTRRADEALVL
jgi:sulfur-oxidizing protein SoxZ